MTSIDFARDTPERLRADLLEHFQQLGLTNLTDAVGGVGQIHPEAHDFDKSGIRRAHERQRNAYLENEAHRLPRWHRAMESFADGDEVDPARIKPVLVPVNSDSFENELFRFATTLWSVPVSRGFGRRMRYLVMDEHNGKLIGIFALGDPVFNLRARDALIGWDQAARRERLVGVMDAYIAGSVPPYSALLGGKLVTSLIGSREVSRAFKARYGESTGIISGINKDARLALVTVTSSLGRSSIYNRLHLRANGEDRTLVRLDPIGMTQGYGHFHLSEPLFARLRYLLLKREHPYANKHQFGDGPNWRMRMIRVALQALGLSPNLTRHGISREVFAMPLVANYRQMLRDGVHARGVARPSLAEIADAARARWIVPRAQRRPEYLAMRRADFLHEQLAIRGDVVPLDFD